MVIYNYKIQKFLIQIKEEYLEVTNDVKENNGYWSI